MINSRVLYCIEILLGFEISPKDLVCQEHLKFLVLNLWHLRRSHFLECSCRFLRFFFLLWSRFICEVHHLVSIADLQGFCWRSFEVLWVSHGFWFHHSWVFSGLIFVVWRFARKFWVLVGKRKNYCKLQFGFFVSIEVGGFSTTLTLFFLHKSLNIVWRNVDSVVK